MKKKRTSLNSNRLESGTIRTRSVLSLTLFFTLLFACPAHAQEQASSSAEGLQKKTVSGVITDLEDAPLPGVSVSIKGTTTGTITDLDGKYVIEDVPENGTLVFSFVGMLTEESTVAGKTDIPMVMLQDIIGLEEIVVVGYGTQLKKDLTSSIGSVNSEDFKQQVVTDVDQILQGRTAGVTVTKASGAPGSSARIRIRGANSIIGDNQPLYVVDGFVGADFESLNPNDIADMKILKDAAATAIYGSRGANGVILINTKGGVVGEAKISFNASYSLSESLKYWDLLSASEYVEVANANNLARGAENPAFTNDEVEEFKTKDGTDWQKEMFRLAKGQSYQLNYSGGTDKTTYYVSGNYLDQEGIVINSNYKRFGIRANVNSNITDKLKANIKTNFTRRQSNNTSGAGGQRSALNQMTAWAPTTDAYDSEGNFTVRDPHGSFFENPLELANNDRLINTNTYSVITGLTYTIIPGLNYDVSLGADITSQEQKDYTLGSLTNPSARRMSQGSVFYQITNIVSYKKVVAEIHNFDFAAISELQKNNFESYGINADQLLIPDLRYYNLVLAETLPIQPYSDGPAISSFLGRVNYDLMGRYLVSTSFRRDGTSNFQSDYKWDNFASVALGWNLHNESFLKDGFFDILKLRASWGQTGSQATGAYRTYSTFDLSARGAGTSFVPGVLTPGIAISNPGNPDLKWETTDQINVGTDMAILDSRLSFTVDAYRKTTHDLLVRVPKPSYVGGGSRLENIGEVLNEGIELNISGTPVQTTDLSWNTSFNASFMHNEVTDLGGLEEIFIDADAGEGSTTLPEGVIRVGHSLSSFYGLTYLGTWKPGEEDLAAVYGAVPGDARYQDMQAPGEDGYGVIDSDDADIIGSGMPNGVYGWNNTVEYKNFTFNLLFQAVSGIERLNFTYASMVSPGVGSNQVTHADVLDRWDAQNNPDSDIPHFSQTTYETIQSSRFVERADFIRLKNLSLSYRYELPTGQELTLMLAASNLFTITKYRGLDPEAYSNAYSGPRDADPRASAVNADTRGSDIGAYPNSKIYTFSLNFNF